jgi:hypothetical protein
MSTFSMLGSRNDLVQRYKLKERCRAAIFTDSGYSSTHEKELKQRRYNAFSDVTILTNKSVKKFTVYLKSLLYTVYTY